MTTNQLILAIAAGLISAVVFASATTGPMLLRFVLFFLTPLSLYLAGLGIGPLAAGIAAIVATLTILMLTNPLAALVFAVSAGAPAALTSRMALLGRPVGDDPSAAQVEWFPIGRIVLAAALFGGIFAFLAVMIMGADVDALSKAMRTLVDSFVKTEMPQIPGSAPLTDVQVDEISQRALGLLPTTLAALSMITTLLNLWLAGRITLASGLLVRPWPELNSIALPATAAFALLIAMAATFMGGLPGLIAGGFVGALTLAFAIVGLAVAHALTRGSPWRNFVLSALYAALVIYTPAIAVLLAVVGLGETIFAYRASGGPPPAEKT
ncbi:MAG TPA: DUF2232 domain-containing protein [Hyphomicrobium sp.]|nr:DUF2232 domain-containing protein [Hyphomicrobium sp.]